MLTQVTETHARRTTQSERTRRMRQRLMEATAECLVELGWAGTTTTLVSDRAGVSRGAQLHHFPTKQDLVVAAVEHINRVRRDELSAVEIPAANRTRVALGLIAEQCTSPAFFAALELWVAARTDEVLHRELAPLERRLGRDTHVWAVELLGVDGAAGRNRELVQATLDLARGLGLAATLSDDSRRRERILDAWAATLDAELER